jgi:membrane protein implicated in regulation of membrane protease activity
MELLVATWSVRLAAVAALAGGVVSLSVGTPPLEAVLRAVAAALVFTLAGHLVLDRLETPEHRHRRLRARRSRDEGRS